MGEESSTYYDKHKPKCWVNKLTRGAYYVSGTIQSAFVCSDSLNAHNNLLKQVLASHFIDKKTEAQRG